MVRIGVPPVRIELLNRVTGVTFGEVWRGRIAGHYDDVPVACIGRAQRIRNNQAAGRPKDLADVDELRRRSRPGGRRMGK